MKKINKLYRFLQIVVKPFYKLFFRMEVIGQENELMDGPCLICANHISNHDILFLALNLKRQIYFFAKRELFNSSPSPRYCAGSARSPSAADRSISKPSHRPSTF